MNVFRREEASRIIQERLKSIDSSMKTMPAEADEEVRHFFFLKRMTFDINYFIAFAGGPEWPEVFGPTLSSPKASLSLAALARDPRSPWWNPS